VSDVFVLADSLSVLSADTAGVMKLWDAEHGATRLSISGPVGHLCLSPSSQLAVSGDLHDTRLVWRTALTHFLRPLRFVLCLRRIDESILSP